MAYNEREILPDGNRSTAYIEFYIGKWDGRSFNKENSMYARYK